MARKIIKNVTVEQLSPDDCSTDLQRDFSKYKKFEDAPEVLISEEEKEEQSAWDYDPPLVSHPDVWQENESTKKIRKIPIGWKIVGLLSIAYILYYFISVPKEDTAEAVIQERSKEFVVKNLFNESQATEHVNGMYECLRSYCVAKSISEMLPYVRNSERVKSEMEQYYSKNRIISSQFDYVDLLLPIDLAGRNFSIVTAKMKNNNIRNLIVEQVDNDHFLVDWEASVAWQPMDWDQYLLDKPIDEKTFRCYIGYDYVYLSPFDDKKKYQCLKITTRNGENYAYGYILRTSPQFSMLTKVLGSVTETSAEPQPFLVSLKFPDSSCKFRTVEIAKLISPHWIEK